MAQTTPRILLAEDSEENRHALKLLLKFSGYECQEAVDGRTAVEMALRERPDLVLMDLSLPEVNGLQATREIRAAGATMPIIIVSAYDDEETRAKAQAAGANDFLPKPIEFERLKALLDEQLLDKLNV